MVGTSAAEDARLEPYLDALRTRGKDPVPFVLAQLDDADLLLFDDALHPAVEPFELYEALIRNAEFQRRVDYVFVETLPINQQRHIDAYLASDPEDLSLLHPALQDDISGMGFALESYTRLLSTLREVNATLPPEARLEVVAVSNPTYWPLIETREDVERFRESLLGRDYDMYRVILERMERFGAGAKGVFLTNTRHAYTGVRDREGDLHWNTGTFFRQNHPGRTVSIRLHNISLHIAAKSGDDGEPRSFEGMERYDYSWVRVGRGIWDSAFAAYGRPVGLAIEGTAFGDEPYIGNHMLDMADGTTMADAYDAVIYLAPYETMRFSADYDGIYTPEFKQKLARRYRLLRTPEQLEAEMEQHGAHTLTELIDLMTEPDPERPLPAVGPIDEWQSP